MARLNSTDNIIRRADALVRSTGTRDPERIAEALGIIVMDVNFEKQKGLLASGYDADFVVLDGNLEVQSTWVSGKEFYKK